MQYLLKLSDVERDYLTARIETALINDASALARLAPEKDKDEFPKARAQLRTGAAIMAALAVERLEVAEDAPRQAPIALYSAAEEEQLARLSIDEAARAADPLCIHGVRSSRPCAGCEESTESINARMAGRQAQGAVP